MRFLLHNETKDETGWCMLDDLEAADGWAELTYDEQTERIRTAFDAQLRQDKGAEKANKPLCKHGDCNRRCLGRGDIRGGVRIVDEHGKLFCRMHRCGNHGGRSDGSHTKIDGSSTNQCNHPGCSKPSRNTQFNFSTDDANPVWWRYCNGECLAADAPRRALFTTIRDKLGQNDLDVQAKLKDLNTKQQPMPPAEALAQLNTIRASGTLQAVQDALDAGPSGAAGA